jgi:hypothetical protein
MVQVVNELFFHFFLRNASGFDIAHEQKCLPTLM